MKLGEDEDEDEKDAGNLSDSGPMKLPKLDQRNASEQSSKQVDVGKLLIIVYLSVAYEVLQVMLKIYWWHV